MSFMIADTVVTKSGHQMACGHIERTANQQSGAINKETKSVVIKSRSVFLVAVSWSMLLYRYTVSLAEIAETVSALYKKIIYFTQLFFVPRGNSLFN